MVRRLALMSILAVASVGFAAAEPFRIAVIAPMQGPYQLVGQAIRDGALLAARTFGGALPGGQALVDIYDDGCDAGKIADIRARLVRRPAGLVIGSLCYRPTLELSAHMDELKAIVVTPAVQDVRLTDAHASPLLFRLAPRDDGQPGLLAARAAALAGKNGVLLLDDGSVYGQGLITAVKQRLTSAGARVASQSAYTPGSTDFSVVAAHLALDPADVLVAGGYEEDLSRLANALQAAGQKVPMLAGDSMTAPLAAGDLGAAAALVTFAAPVDPRIVAPSAPEVAALTLNGLPPDPMALRAYVAVQLYAAAAAKAGGGNIFAIADALRKGGKTAYGTIRFNDRGDVAGDNGLIGYRLYRYSLGAMAEVN